MTTITTESRTNELHSTHKNRVIATALSASFERVPVYGIAGP